MSRMEDAIENLEGTDVEDKNKEGSEMMHFTNSDGTGGSSHEVTYKVEIRSKQVKFNPLYISVQSLINDPTVINILRRYVSPSLAEASSVCDSNSLLGAYGVKEDTGDHVVKKAKRNNVERREEVEDIFSLHHICDVLVREGVLVTCPVPVDSRKYHGTSINSGDRVSTSDSLYILVSVKNFLVPILHNELQSFRNIAPSTLNALNKPSSTNAADSVDLESQAIIELCRKYPNICKWKWKHIISTSMK